jgi:hypothetical protein
LCVQCFRLRRKNKNLKNRLPAKKAQNACRAVVGCVVFWLWREIVLKMRTRFYQIIFLGSFIMIRLFLENIKTFLWKYKLANNRSIPSKQQP